MASDGSRPSLPMPLDLGHLPETFRHLGGGTSSEADRCPQTSGDSHRFLGIFVGAFPNRPYNKYLKIHRIRHAVRWVHGPPIFKHSNQTTAVDVFFLGRPPLRPLARELLRFAREVACPPRLAKMAATDREGSIAGRIAVRSPCTLI